MQIVSIDKTVRSDTIQDLRDFNSQSLSTQAKKGEQFVSVMPARKNFPLIGSNESLKNEIGSYDEKWLEESKAKLLKQIDLEKSNFIYVKKEKTNEKTTLNGLY